MKFFKYMILFFWVLWSSAFAEFVSAELDSAFSGEFSWDETSGLLTFTNSGAFNFDQSDYKFFIYHVPTDVKKIIIQKDVTITGAFHFYDDCTIVGEDRKTSVVYGTTEQRWADNRSLDEWHYCQFQVFGGTLHMENLTCLNPFSYHVRGWGSPIHAKKCDFIDTRGGSQNHSDGFTGGHGSTVDSCYFETGDDVIKVYFDITVTNTEIKMVENAVPIQFGWGSYGSGAVGVFENVSITGTSGRGSVKRVIAAHAGEYSKKLILKNCTIDNPNGALFSFLDDRANIDVFMAQTAIDVRYFRDAMKGVHDIFINGEHCDPISTTKHQWDAGGEPDTVAPTIEISMSDSSFVFGDTIAVSAEVTDNLNQIYRAELYMNNKMVQKVKQAPFQFKLPANAQGQHELYVKAIDADLNSTDSSPIRINVKSENKPVPFNGTPLPIPGRIEAEAFDLGGEGVSYHDSDVGRAGGDAEFRSTDAPDVEFGPWENPSGGTALAWVAQDEWYRYSIQVPETGDYYFYVGYCSPNDSNQIRFRIDDVVMDSISFNKTGDEWNIWGMTDHFVTIPLQKGRHVLQVDILRAGFNFDFIDIQSAVSSVATVHPNQVELLQNYPNPFNPITQIRYTLPEQNHVKLAVYDLLGRNVNVLVNEFQAAGTYTIEFHGSHLPSGFYMYRLETDKHTLFRKMLILK